MSSESDAFTTAIAAYVAAHPELHLSSAPTADLPTAIPLAWPTDLHRINFLSTLHLAYLSLANASHSALLSEIGEGAADLAIRGCMGLYLASEQAWDASNYLSAAAWRDGLLDEARVAEYFGINVLRERQHESLPIHVGERHAPAVSAVGDLVTLFKTLGDKITGRCVGEDVQALLPTTMDQVANGLD